MTWINANRITDKLIAILADNRVMPSEWKYAVPLFLAQQPLPIIYNAKNLADGIQYNIELYGIEVPPDKLASDPYSKDYLLN